MYLWRKDYGKSSLTRNLSVFTSVIPWSAFNIRKPRKEFQANKKKLACFRENFSIIYENLYFSFCNPGRAFLF
jgi:hypothetical protein